MVDRWRVVNNLEIKKDNLVLKVRVSTIEITLEKEISFRWVKMLKKCL